MVYCNVSAMSLVLDAKLHEQLKDIVNKNTIKYSSFSDFVRKAIYEKLEREGVKVDKQTDYGF
jgi:Arc/MetJ-type ribon-helix-helix transcriptional regulator